MGLSSSLRAKRGPLVLLAIGLVVVVLWELSGDSSHVQSYRWRVEANSVPSEIAKQKSVTASVSSSRPSFKPLEGEWQDVSPVGLRLKKWTLKAKDVERLCSQFEEDCNRWNSWMGHLSEMVTNDTSVRLHVVPVDPLAWMYQTDKEKALAAMKSFAAELKSERSYIKFKGSDYVFTCLSASCRQLGEIFAVVLANDEGTRAMFAGIDLQPDVFKWPCPLRIIPIPKEGIQDLSALSKELVQKSMHMIERSNRWVCSDEHHPANYFGEHIPSMSSGGVYMQEYGFLMCQIPKSGSTMLMFLLRRMMHKENWKSTEHGLPHNPYQTGVKYMNNDRNFSLMKAIYDDPRIIKAAVVRNPYTRLLSGYLDKIDSRKEYGRVIHLPSYVKKHGHPSFKQFVYFLLNKHPDPRKLDAHFKLQSTHCGLEDHRFDFVGSLDDLAHEFKEFADSLDFWDEYCASGWGSDGTGSFGGKSYQTMQHHSCSKVWSYYTEDMLKRAYKYYKEDFNRFGYTLEEALAMKTAENVTLATTM